MIACESRDLGSKMRRHTQHWQRSWLFNCFHPFYTIQWCVCACICGTVVPNIASDVRNHNEQVYCSLSGMYVSICTVCTVHIHIILGHAAAIHINYIPTYKERVNICMYVSCTFEMSNHAILGITFVLFLLWGSMHARTPTWLSGPPTDPFSQSVPFGSSVDVFMELTSRISVLFTDTQTH